MLDMQEQMCLVFLQFMCEDPFCPRRSSSSAFASSDGTNRLNCFLCDFDLCTPCAANRVLQQHLRKQQQQQQLCSKRPASSTTVIVASVTVTDDEEGPDIPSVPPPSYGDAAGDIS